MPVAVLGPAIPVDGVLACQAILAWVMLQSFWSLGAESAVERTIGPSVREGKKVPDARR